MIPSATAPHSGVLLTGEHEARDLLKASRAAWIRLGAAETRIRDTRCLGGVWYQVEATSGGLPLLTRG